MRAAVRELHPALVVFGAATMDQLIAQQTSASRFTSWVLSLFAVAALILSLIGVYGVMAYLVAQRTREFGIRLALGATRTELVTAVLRQGARLIALGVVIGAVASLGLTRVLGGLLYQVTLAEASSALAVLLLATVAVLAFGEPFSSIQLASFVAIWSAVGLYILDSVWHFRTQRMQAQLA